MQYLRKRKKDVPGSRVKAVQITSEWLGGNIPTEWFDTVTVLPTLSVIKVHDAFGLTVANEGDWVVRDSLGVIRWCRSDVFSQVYKRVED